MMGGGGADSGQAANGGGGWFSGWSWPSMSVGDMAPDATATQRWTETLKGIPNKANAALEAYPGYGDLWTIAPGGVSLTMPGKLALAGLALGLVFLMGRR